MLLAFLSIRKVPASLALLAATLFAGVLGAFLQPDVYADFVAGSGNVVVESLKAIWLAMANGFSIDSGIPDVDRLLSRGGMDSMLLTIWLIIGAVTFGAMLEEFGLINRLVNPMIAAATSTGRLFVTVFACGFGLNVVAGDQYIALVLPSRIFRAEFARRGLAPTNLSRLAADSGTVTSPLVPWNSCGAFMGATLGVSTLLYLPYAVFCYASPALSVLYGVTGFKIEKIEPTELQETGMTTQTEEAPAGGAVAKMSVPTLTAMVVGGMVGAGRLLAAGPVRRRDRHPRLADRVGDRRHRHADAGLRLPDPRDPQARARLRRLHLRQGRLRRLRGLQLRDRLLGQLDRRQHLLLGVHRRHARRVLRRLRRRRHGPGRRGRPRSGVWLFHYLIARGVRDAAVINRIVTVFKIIPILVFIVVMFFYFDAGVFADNWTATGYGDLGDLNEQVRNTMLITTFVFIGIEGASVYSRYAKKREDVGKATVMGFLSVLSIFALVTLSSYAVVPQPELADTRQPSMVGVFQSQVGRLGRGLHQRRRDRVGARRLPRLDADGRRGHVHPGPRRTTSPSSSARRTRPAPRSPRWSSPRSAVQGAARADARSSPTR